MADDLTCAVCGDSVTDPGLLSECLACGSTFHLNPRSDVAGIDCGDVWSGDPEAPALQFYCQRCIDRMQAAAIAQSVQVAPEGVPPAPPGMPALPPGAPPEVLAAMAGWQTPPALAGDPTPSPLDPPSGAQPPLLQPRPRRRRRFRRIDTDGGE